MNTYSKTFEGREITATVTSTTPNKWGNICIAIHWGDVEALPTFRSLDAFETFWADDEALRSLIDEAAHNG